MGRVPDQSYRLVAAFSQQTLQQQRDLPVPARDHYPHAASLLTRSLAETTTPPAGRAAIVNVLMVHPRPGRAEQPEDAIVAAGE